MKPFKKNLAEFIKAFNGSMDARLWIKLIKEELEELKAEEIGTTAHLKEMADVHYVVAGLCTVTTTSALESCLSDEEFNKLVSILEEFADLAEECEDYYGMGIIDEAIQRVHKSNMSKLGEDGKPILREDGKVLKGPNYKAPDLSDLIEQKETEQ